MDDPQNESKSPKFKDHYRISSARLTGWDYTNAGCYFVTLCTRQREAVFGEVVNAEMILS